MPNPFDQFDASNGNPFDQFDEPGIGQQILGGAEGALSTASGLVSAIPYGIRALGELAATGNLNEALDRADSSREAATYNPKTELGKQDAEYVNKIMQDYSNTVSTNFASDAAFLNQQKLKSGAPLTARDLSAENTEQTLGEVLSNLYVPGIPLGLRGKGKLTEAQTKALLDKMKADEAAKQAAPEATAVNPFDQFDANTATPADPFAQMKSQLGTPQELPPEAEPTPPAVPAFDAMRQTLEEAPARQAQAAIDARQAQMEQDVARQGTLDYNAAERARQVGAPATPEAVAADPRVADLADRLDKHNESLIKMGGDVEAGRLPESFLDRGVIENESLQGMLDDAKTQAERDNATPPNPGTPAFIPKSQRGAINPEVFKEGFEKIKELADGTRLRAYFDGRGLQIEASKNGATVAHADFDTPRDVSGNAKAAITTVDPSFQKQGLATEMYKYASELGNDISPADAQTKAGKAMWQGFERQGLANNGVIKSPGNRQLGGLLFGEKQPLEKVIGKSDMIPEDVDPQKVIEQARSEKDGRAINNIESGATLAAAKRGSTAIAAVGHYVQNAEKRGALNIRKFVTPVENAFRKLARSPKEFDEVAEVLKNEEMEGKRFPTDVIENNLSLKQQVAYAHFRKMWDDIYTAVNEQRKAQGLEPITRREAYLAYNWQGDFRRPLFEAVLDNDGNPKVNADGTIQKKLVWYLAAHSKMGLEHQTKALLKERPDLMHDPKEDHVVRYYQRKTDLQQAMSIMIDTLGRDDPSVQKMAELVANQTLAEGQKFQAYDKHMEDKAGVRGFVGDRPGKSARSENIAMMQHQIDTAKTAYNYIEMQKAASKVKAILSDPDLKANQPNNMKYIRDYWKNALGMGEKAAIAGLEDAIRDLGFSPTLISKGIGDMKSVFLLQKIGTSARYTIANLVQHSNMIPHLISDEFGKDRSGLLTAIPLGIGAGIATALGHFYTHFMGPDAVRINPDKANFFLRAAKYAEDNGITMRSIQDESPLSHSFGVMGPVTRGLGATLSIPETFARSMAFFTAVEYLRSSGKFAKDADLFKKAEDLVNIAMVDYRNSEKPLFFRKLGFIGSFLNTLQTYPINWYNQWNLTAREAFKGNVAPFMAMFAVQYALGGAMNIPGFEDMNKLYQLLKDKVISNSLYAKAQQSEFWSSPKMWMVNHLGTSSIYGALATKSNLGVSSSITAPTITDMMSSPAGPITDLAKQAANIGKLALNPTRDNAAQVAMASSPVGLQGVMAEYNPLFKGSTLDERTVNGQKQTLAMMPGQIEKHQAVYARTPEEDTMRKFGLRSTKETIEREVGYLTNRATSVANERARNIPDQFYAEVKQGNMARAKDLYQAYVSLTGKGISSQQLEQQIQQNYLTTVERASTAAKSVTALQNVTRMRAILQQIQKDYGQ